MSRALLLNSSFSNPSVSLSTSQLILRAFHHFIYVTAHFPNILSLYLCHSSFSKLSITSPTSQLILQPSVALPTSQLILQLFHHFTYVTAHSPILQLLHLRHSLFSNPSFAFPTSHALHLCHLASRPWFTC